VERGGHVTVALHVGDAVLSDDPRKGCIEPEPVQRVIKDPDSPLIAVGLSDGGAITVTADHPFWIDAGANLSGPGWLPAGRLEAGDRLRTADGRDAIVTGLRRNMGQAVVYTLTVARDHTYFVGTDQVLVHNCGGSDSSPATPVQLDFFDQVSGDSNAASVSADSFDRDAAIASARAARDMIGRIPKQGKTVAAVDDGRRTLSGWAVVPGFEQATDKVLTRADDMNYLFRPHGRDGDIPGRYYASYAEPQMAEVAPDKPMAVSWLMCGECQDYFSALAQHTGVPKTIADPMDTRVFYPDGRVEEFPG